MTHPVQLEHQKTPQPFHTLSEDKLFLLLGSSPGGLTSAQVQAGLARFGHNDIFRIRKSPLIFQYLGHFKDPFVIILLIAAAISLFVGEITNALIIVIIILASVTLNFFQEYKAGNAAELLKQKLVSKATVSRDGLQIVVPVTDLVPGDVVFLAAGDIVPADARVLDERDLYVNQSALTGEPFPVGKTAGREDPAKPLAEAGNYLFLGTSVVSGTATALVTRTGMATEFGHVAKTLSDRPPETEFERGLKQFSFLMSKVIFFLVIFVFL